MTDRRLRGKHYALGVMSELHRLGYSKTEAKTAFLRHYRGMKRSYGLYMNMYDFAIMIDEIERALDRKYDPENPDHIYIGHLREQMKKTNNKSSESSKTFKITEEMEQKINEWDSCVAIDVTGAKFAYIFVPTGLGLVIKVQCDVCKRELDLSEW